MTRFIARKIQILFFPAAGVLYFIGCGLASIPGPAHEDFTPWHPWLGVFFLLSALTAVCAVEIILGYEEEERAKVAEKALRT